MPTLLVVDDDPMTLGAARDHLNAMGYRVLTAPDAVKGAMTAVVNRPDVIITDFLMPGLPGQSIFDQLTERPETKDIPVIIMSGYPPESIQPYVPMPLRHNILHKPINYKLLHEMIQGLMRRRPKPGA